MNELLVCKYNKCNKYLEDPIMLPCSNNVCKSHVNELIQNKNRVQFKCYVCQDKHEVPPNGFINNTMASQMIELKVHLNDNEKKVAQSIDKLKDQIKQFELTVKDPENYIFETFSTIRNQIDLERERLIQEINKTSDEMLANLLKHENECKQKHQKLGYLYEQQNEYLKGLTSHMLKIKDEMRVFNKNEKEIDKILKQSNQLLSDLNEKFCYFKEDLMMNKIISFQKFNGSFVFGKLLINNFENCNLESSKILKKNQLNDLIKLCEFNNQNQFKLLYQATKDGFSAKTFHKKCDGLPNILTLIKVKGNSNVFGGFCSVGWDDFSEWKIDSKAFIFSLINKENQPLKINVSQPSLSIYCHERYGPFFGTDIVISNNSNTNRESYSDLGFSYANNIYLYGTTEANNYLAGSFNFSTEEIEVFQVYFRY